jgi:hypothetical protein
MLTWMVQLSNVGSTRASSEKSWFSYRTEAKSYTYFKGRWGQMLWLHM